ncbi:MAG: M48 family metallopeptidase [Microscillaceae bacterium]|jgi:STE24 endopeptidase|nr:M48 family metallopeptidase [Microscillaceae bacterium]
MTPEIIFALILAIYVFDFVLENYLDYLNLQYKKLPLPAELASIYTPEEYQKSLAYQRANFNFGFLSGGLSFVVTLILLLTGFFGFFSDYLKNFIPHPIAHGLAYFAILSVVGDILTLPLQWYAIFVIEEKFGFNKTTPRLFMLDKIKGYLLGGLIGGLLGWVFLYLVLEIGQIFWLYFWLISLAFSLFMSVFYTNLILPWFNKLTPLPEGELRQAIESYCQKVNFPLTNLFVIDGSKRSTKANAFFTGLGKQKKVVLYDTLIEKHSQEELVAVLAHEVGHYKKRHIPVSLTISALQTGLILYVLSLFIFNPSLSQALGAKEWSIPLNLMAFSYLLSPISMLIGLLFNQLSRKNEFEADRYARDTYEAEALATALKKLSASNLSNLNPHPWYVFFHYSHPPLLQRLRALRS